MNLPAFRPEHILQGLDKARPCLDLAMVSTNSIKLMFNVTSNGIWFLISQIVIYLQ